MTGARKCNNYLETYMQYTKREDTIPPAFHLWCCISTIAAAMERKCWIPLFGSDDKPLFPNLYICLLGGPATGKSVSSKTAISDIYMKAISKPMLPSNLTEAWIKDAFAALDTFKYKSEDIFHTSHYLYFPEASQALREGEHGIKAFLTALYDCLDSYNHATKSKGVIKVKNTCMNFLMGCTPSYLAEIIPQKEIQGGFASRLIFVKENARHADAIGLMRTQAELQAAEMDSGLDRRALQEDLIHDLQDIHNAVGPFTWHSEVADSLDRYFVHCQKESKESRDENVQAVLSRKLLAVQKVSMCLSMAQDSSRIITMDHMNMAQNLIDDTTKKILPSIENMPTGDRNLDRVIGVNRNILAALDEPMTEHGLLSTLYRKGHLKPEISAALQTLVEINKVVVEDGEYGVTYIRA